MEISLGDTVLYVWRAGQVRAGEAESTALVTKVNGDGTANLIVFQDGSPDPLKLRAVQQFSQDVQGHCWRHRQDSTAARQAKMQHESKAMEISRIDARIDGVAKKPRAAAR